MRMNLTLMAPAFFALTLGVAHAADAPSTNQPNTGAAVGTPGTESKGNPIPVPPQATGGTADQGKGGASATTPAEESKGNNKAEPLTTE
jgi:hypothetical protein